MSLPCLRCLRTALSNEAGWERIKPMLECPKGQIQNTCARCKAKRQSALSVGVRVVGTLGVYSYIRPD